MEPLAYLLAGTALAFWASYWVGTRFPLLAALIGVLLLCGAIMIVHLDLSSATLGDGAPASAAAFIGFLWILEVIGILLAATLFLAGWRSKNHPISKVFFIFLFIPTLAYAIFSALPKQNLLAKVVPQTERGQVQLGTQNDGYVWAIDNQFLSDKECKNGSPEFLAGCRRGVAKNQARNAN